MVAGSEMVGIWIEYRSSYVFKILHTTIPSPMAFSNGESGLPEYSGRNLGILNPLAESDGTS